MKPSNRRLPAILIVLAVLVLASLACSLADVNLKSGSARITVTLNENEINRMIAHSDNTVNDPDLAIKEITGVELNQGFIRIIGKYDKPDGSEAIGSYDVALSAENGELKAEITGVDIEGMDLNDERVQRMNTDVAEALDRSARESHGEVEYESVVISDSALTIVVETNWKEQ